MPCSPLLKGVTDPLEVLKIVNTYPVLCHSEPSAAFYPLEAKGWVKYKNGAWRITEEGKAALPEQLPEPAKFSLSEFFSTRKS